MNSHKKANGHSGSDVRAKWQSVAFEQCIEKLRHTNKIQRSAFLEEGAYPVVSQEDGLINGYWNEQSDVFTVSRPLTVFGDHTRVLKYVDFDFVLGADGVKILQPKTFLNPKFFHYQMQSFSFPSLGYARHYRLLKNKEVLFPPIEAQERIVAILDEAFAGIAKVKANAEKNLESLSLLANAAGFPAEPILGKKRHTLAELCEFIVDCEHKTAPTQAEGIPSIRTPNIGRGILILEGVNRVSEETYHEWTRRAEPAEGDLIFAREAPAGNVAVVPPATKLCLGQRTVLLRPKRQLIDSAFLAHLILHPATQQRWLGHSRGATVQHVNLKDIRALSVGNLPPLEEQVHAVKRIDALSEELEKSACMYKREIAASDELRQSLLHQAFSGNL